MSLKSKPYFIYGKHSVLSALKNPNRSILRALCIEEFTNNKDFKKYISSANFQITSRANLDKLLGTSSVHQGIAIEVLPITSHDLEIIDFNAHQTVVILDQITDQHNFGSILRSAVTFNIKNIIISSTNCVKENSTLAKTSSGALELVNLIEVVNINQTIETLKKKDFWVIGLDHNAEACLHEYQAPNKLAIILGSEDQGIRKLTKQKCDTLVKIPILQTNLIDSLNVSIAASISFYEIFKQRASIK
jgi:23S rRNA (guanosine2251-2'-O)-methyltransferase